jgi:hypothetical protein
MLSDLHHPFTSGETRPGSTPERLARIVGAMTFGTLILAGAHFGFLYLFAGR